MATTETLSPSVSSLKNDEISEKIEWDLPSYDSFDGDFPIDLCRLSLGTEMRNKMWETDNKISLGSMVKDPNSSSSSSSPLSMSDVTQQMQPTDTMQFFSTNGTIGTIQSQIKVSQQSMPSSDSSMFVGVQSNGNLSPAGSGGGIGSQNGLKVPVKFLRSHSQPLLQSPIQTNIQTLADRKTPELLSPQSPAYPFDPRRLNESQTIKEELLEMKSIITRLAANTTDISGLPQPVQLLLKLIDLEGVVKEKDSKIGNQELLLVKKNYEAEKLKKEHDFEIAVLKKEMKLLREQLDCKSTLEASNKGRITGKNEKADVSDIENLQEELKTTQEAYEKKIKEGEELQTITEHKRKMALFESSKNEKELKLITEKYEKEQAKMSTQKAEIERIIAAVRDSMERERQDRYLLLVEQNKLKHKVEKLSETCKSYQMKNEELCRIQNELEQECDQFRKLKKIIQEHGLPNHEQLVLLQQQSEMFKDDALSERKDRERAQMQRDKLRRDLEEFRARNASLQEQIYKYQEHIMMLNTCDRRSQQQPPSFPVQGGGNRHISRQLSNPAYFNPKIRMGMTFSNPLNKLHSNVPTMGHGSIDTRPPMPDLSPMTNSFPNAGINNRFPGRGLNGGFEQWQNPRNGYHQQQPITQQTQQHTQISTQQLQQQQQQIRGSTSNGSSGYNSPQAHIPQSPLLTANGDPWVMPTVVDSQSPRQQQHPIQQAQPQHTNGSVSYNTNIWSQQPATSSPTPFSMQSANMCTESPNWQLADREANPTPNSFVSINGVATSKSPPGNELWSTATNDIGQSVSEHQQQQGATTQQHYKMASSISEIKENVDGQVAENNNGVSNEPVRLQCRKCNTKLPDTDSFREHAEKCFN